MTLLVGFNMLRLNSLSLASQPTVTFVTFTLSVLSRPKFSPPFVI
jgi:hypothetical protein